MNTAKPSIPSSNGGAADDLIEELARLMAESAQENSENSTPSASAAKPKLMAANSPGQKFRSQNPPPASYQSAAKSAPKPQTPQAQTQSSTLGEKFTPAQNFSNVDAGQGSASEVADKPKSGILSPARPASASPASDLSRPAPVAPRVSSSLPGDPIADIIRAQSALENDAGTLAATPDENRAAPAPKAAANGEPAPAPGDSGASGQKADLQGRDKFRVPPVFGLSGKPGPSPAPNSPPVAPVAGRAGSAAASAKTNIDKPAESPDALDEIESLIGNAVRVDFPEQSSSARPGAQDKKQNPPQDKIDSAEDAILQAMAAIGESAQEKREKQEKQEKQENNLKPPSNADLGGVFVDDGLNHEPTENDDPAAGEQAVGADKTAGRRSSRFLVPIGAGVVLLGAVFGGYWVLTSTTDNGDAPVLTADSAPSKQAPAPGQESSGGQSGQFSDVAGNSGVNANADASANANVNANERLVSRDQSTDAIGNEIRRVITADTTESGLANRRVRTVTVRPDGTIISGDAAVAGGQVLPVARPEVPQLPANALNPELSGTTVAALPSSPLPANNAQSPDVAPTALIAPIPRPRPANRAALVATSNSAALDLIAGTSTPAPVPPAPIATTTTPEATPAASATGGDAPGDPTAWVQMASRRSQEAATQSAASLQTKYTSLFGSAKLEVKRIDLGDRGIFYRVLLPAATLDEASSVCNAIKSAGGDCFTRNN